MNAGCTQACDVRRIISGTSKPLPSWTDATGVSAGLKGDRGHCRVTTQGEGVYCGLWDFR